MNYRLGGLTFSRVSKLPVRLALQQIGGIGKRTSNQICDALGYEESLKISDINDEIGMQINKQITKMELIIGAELKRQTIKNQRRLASIRCRRGIRLQKGQPNRGQRTSSNARTAKKRNRIAK